MSASRPTESNAEKYATKPPAAVAAAAAEADRLLQESTQSSEEAKSAEPALPEPEAPKPEARDLVQSPHPQPAPLPGAAKPNDFEHRYNSAMGRLTKSEDENRRLHERLNGLERLLSSVQAAKATEAKPQAPAPTRLITEEEERDYGGEFLSVVGKKAKEELLPEISTLNARIEDMAQRMAGIGQTMVRSSEEKVWDHLKTSVPEAEQLNEDPNFIQWLEETEPYSGVPRNVLLRDAYTRHDAGRVASIFQGYKSETAVTDPQPRSRPASNGSAKPALRDYAAPGRATSPPQQAGAGDKPTYTNADIAHFFRLKQTGKFRGREAEADAVEADIFAAQHEGRIR